MCGATGVGKSSLINDFFEFDKDSAAPVGSSGKPQTRGIHEYHSKSITLFDTEGYEVKLVYAGKQRFLQKYNRSDRRTQKYIFCGFGYAHPRGLVLHK